MERQYLGEGYSGVVFRQGDEAIKVFKGNWLSNPANIILQGTPNPYIWSEDAVATAHYRRNILATLTQYWFSGKLRVSESLGYEFNTESKSYELRTRFVDGVHPHLRNPWRKRNNDLEELLGIMEPLQEKLLESGFVGAAWQAGRHNHTATANFVKTDEWEWIDMESGLPSLTRYNFPDRKSPMHVIHDDIDISGLRKYLSENSIEGLEDQVDLLEYHYNRWKNDVKNYKIDLNLLSMPIKLGEYTVKGIGKAASAIKSTFSHKTGRAYVQRRIAEWEARGNLEPWQADILREQLVVSNSAHYVSDFGAHGVFALADKASPIVFPVLFGTGILEPEQAAAGLVFAGAAMRTSYTLFRYLQANFLPWNAMKHVNEVRKVKRNRGVRAALFHSFFPPYTLALAVGVIPTVGLMAYPAQMIKDAPNEEIGQFIIYSAITQLGEVPIIGGENTRTEYLMNDIAGKAIDLGLKIHSKAF